MDINAKDLATRLIQLASRPVSPSLKESQSYQEAQVNQTNSESETSSLLPIPSTSATHSKQINSQYIDFKQQLKPPQAGVSQTSLVLNQSTEYKNLLKNQQILYKQFNCLQKQILESHQLVIEQNINSAKYIYKDLQSKPNSVGFWWMLISIVFLLLIIIALITFDCFFK